MAETKAELRYEGWETWDLENAVHNYGIDLSQLRHLPDSQKHGKRMAALISSREAMSRELEARRARIGEALDGVEAAYAAV